MKPASPSIPLFNRTKTKLLFSKGLTSFLIAILVFVGFSLGRRVASASKIYDGATDSGGEPLPSLQGDKAIEQLKQQGTYNSLQDAIGAIKYEATRQPSPKIAGLGSAYEFKNSANNLLAYVSADGIDVTSLGEMKKNWRLGLKLTGYGYGNALSNVQSGGVTAKGNRVEINRSSALSTEHSGLTTEWFVNSSRGIEHGFTFASAPGGRRANEPLRLILEMSGDLQLSINGTSDGAAFHSAANDVLLSYNKLFAIDAKRRALAATMKRAGRGLVIEVDDAGAEYPLTIDPLLNQQQKLRASDAAGFDLFGDSVAISADTVIVGSPFDTIGANSNQGSAYIFIRSGATWTEQQKLIAADGGELDVFGRSVGISGDVAVVGAPGNDVQGAVYIFIRSGTTWTQQQKLLGDASLTGAFGASVGVDNDVLIVGASSADVGDNINQGAAYVFARNGASWIMKQKLIANDGTSGDSFGNSVALSNNTLVIGSFGDNGHQGSAYVFVNNNGFWSQQQKLVAIDGASNELFGVSVAISEDIVLVGAPGDDIGTSTDRGAAYVFVRNGETWTLQQKLIAADAADSDQFGCSVAISGNTALVGALFDSIGTNTNQGSAYMFVRTGPIWTQQQKLTAVDGGSFDLFGSSVAISGDTSIVGSPRNLGTGSVYIFVCEYNEQSHLVATDGAANDQFGFSVGISGDTAVVGAYVDDVGANVNQGSAYVFIRTGSVWTQQQRLTAGDGTTADRFGNSVAIAGDTLVVGAPFHKVGANLDQGAAYVFIRTGTTWAEQAQLNASDGAASDQFGGSVAINGDTVVVGASHDAVGANSSQGSAYVFTRNAMIWTQQQKLSSGDGAASDLFGVAVAISGDTIVVGSYFDDVGSNQDQGSAYVFTRSGTIWVQQQKLTASDGAAGDLFGFSVAISGDTVAIGAFSDDISANADQGSAYVFTRSGVTWSQQQKLTQSDGAAGDAFGYSVAISGGTILVGAIGDTVGANASQGSASLFMRSGAIWSQRQKLIASDGALVDEFGVSAAIDGDTVVVGAFFDDVGSNLNQGSAYIFFKGCNTSPVIDASGSVARQQGSAATSSIIANVADSQDPIGYLSVSVSFAPPDISITNITNNNGVITATISASCNAAPGNNIVTLQVQDSDGAVASVQLLVNVSANSLPALGSYSDTSVLVTSSTTAIPSFAPSDNGAIVQFSATSPTFAGTLGASRSSGNITIANARPAGSHIITVTAIDNCGDTISSAFVLTVTCQTITVNPPTIPAATAGIFYSQTFTQTGGNGTVTFIRGGATVAGLNFVPATATLSGTPTQVGNFAITITATDQNGCAVTRAYVLTINAPTLTWTGDTSSDWNTPTNWSPNAVPASYHDVLIPSSGVVNEPAVDNSSSVIHAMTIQSGRILTIKPARQLITQGDITSSGQIAGDGLLAFEGASFTQNGAVSVSSVQFDPGDHSLGGDGVFASGIVTVLNGGRVNLASDHSISVLVINSGGSFFANGRTLTMTGPGTPIFSSGTFTTPGSTIAYAGSVSQVVTSNFGYNNLTINNSAGVSLAGDTTVTGLLNLVTDLTAGSFTLTMPASGTSIGNGDVIGNVKRTGFIANGPALSFGNPFNTIRFNTGTAPTDVTVNLDKSPPAGFSGTVARSYKITPNGGNVFTANLRLHYKDSEAVGLDESMFELWRFNGTTWDSPAGTATRDTSENWVEESGITAFSLWTIAGPSGPTEVKLISFDATGYDTGVLLEWKTGFEVDNLGFRLYRESNGAPALLNSELIAGSALTAGSGTVITAGRSYNFWLNEKQPGSAVYWLEDIDLNGRSTWHGPFGINRLGGKPPARSFAESLSQIGNHVDDNSTRPVDRARKAISIGSSSANLRQTSLAASGAIKIGVIKSGWYRISQNELVHAGLDPKTDPRRLRLFVDGVELAIQVTGEDDGRFDPNDSIEFYGIGLDTPSTDTRVYWLTGGSEAGLRIRRLPQRTGFPAGDSFPYSVERRDRSIYFSNLKNGDQENFFGPVITSTAINQRLVLNNINRSAGDNALIEVSIQGVTRLPHQVAVSLNGSNIGSVFLSGQENVSQAIAVTHSALREGENLVSLQSINGPSDISLVDKITITYQHSYHVDDDRLAFTLLGGESATISGFSSKAIRVFDVTDERGVQEMDVFVDLRDGGYAATVTANEGTVAGARKLLAVSDEKIELPSSITSDKPSQFREARNAADFIIIAGEGLIDAVRPLAELRSKQGLITIVVDIQDLYDEFSFGEKSPQSIRDFLFYATATWKLAPRFVLLAGDASYDARNYLGFGNNDFVPTKLVDTVYMETSSDDWFADVDEDGVADLAVGRLPGRSAAGIAALVGKYLAYEQTKPSEEITLVADSSEGFNFEESLTNLRPLIPSSYRVNEIFRSSLDDATARTRVLESINRGQKIVNYAGHGSENVWRGNLLNATDGGRLKNQDHQSLFIMMTCLNGYFHDASSESLAESLLNAENGGAVAVWASSGLTAPQGQAIMNRELYRLLFRRGSQELRLGELIRLAKRATSDSDVRRSWILLGDPTFRMR